MKTFLGVIVAACLAWACPAASDQRWSATYDVQLLGAKIGEISFAGTQRNGGYAARSRFRTTGLVAGLKRMHADVSVTGRTSGAKLTPFEYSEAIDNGRRVTNVKVRFAGQAPRLVAGETGSSAPPADTSGLHRALDPLTALYTLLRDRESSETCPFVADIYDGHRHARLELTARQTTENGFSCSGHYRRISGYSSAEKTSRRVPITVNYVPEAGRLRALRISVRTKYGKALLVRR